MATPQQHTRFWGSTNRSAKHTLIAAGLAIIASAVFALSGSQGVEAASAPILASPEQGQSFTAPAPVLAGTAQGASEVLVFIDSVLNGAATVTDSRFLYVPFLPLGSGGHAIQLQARDAASGELSELSLVTLITVIPNPSPALLVPSEGAKLGADRAWVGGVAANGSLVRILVDGVERARTQAKDHASGTASFGTELKGLGLGEHAITAVARDSRGKESFASHALTINILPPTPAPVLFRPVVNADSGIERPFITGIAKNGFVVSIVVDGKILQQIPLGQDPSGVISFAYQPRLALGLGRHTIETFASDRGKLSNNSLPIYWQVGDAVPSAGIIDDEEPVPAEEPAATENQGEEPKSPIAVSEPEKPTPLTVTDLLAEPGEPEQPVVPDALPEAPLVPQTPAGRIIADDEGSLGAADGPKELAQADEEAGAEDDEVTEIAPGAVVRQTDGAASEFTLNTSLVIGIVILVFLLLSILVWYIQEKRSQLGERVVSIFKEDDESVNVNVTRLPGDKEEKKEGEKRKPDNTPPPPELPRYDMPPRFDGPDDLPPPPPPMF
ncbi:MAG: hypothetical protein HYT31_05005 [Parcubacteria group bacterium]|nr:hypothetical protein [Parcubacteria group bacterium]